MSCIPMTYAAPATSGPRREIPMKVTNTVIRHLQASLLAAICLAA